MQKLTIINGAEYPLLKYVTNSVKRILLLKITNKIGIDNMPSV